MGWQQCQRSEVVLGRKGGQVDFCNVQRRTPTENIAENSGIRDQVSRINTAIKSNAFPVENVTQ